ncbi:MAG: hypothetical protein H6R14_768 [Proteobacteria bacterium]|nr:hypothetical protein [Pseudomonadota bacterium]
MTDGLKIQGEVVLSAEGAEATLNRVADVGDKMASRLQESSKKAGEAVDHIGEGAGKSAEQFTRAEGRIIDSIKRATTSLEQFGKTASEKLELKIADRGLDTTKFEPYLAKLRELEAAHVRLNNSGQSAASAMGGQFTNNVRNASFQLQDYIVQVNGGVDSTKALAMQLPQLLGGFGAAGAVIGVVAALMPQIVSAFSDTAAGSKTLASSMSDLDKAVGGVGEAVKKFDLDGLYEQFNKANGATRAAIVEQLNFQRTFIETQRLAAGQKFGESISSLGAYGSLDKLAGAYAGNGADKLAKQLGIGVDTARELLPMLSGIKAGTEDVTLAFNRFGTTLLGGNQSARDLASQMAELSKSERDAAGAASAISEAQAKMASGHVQTKKEAEDATKATKALASQNEDLAKLLDSINGKSSQFDPAYVKNVTTLLSAYDRGKLSLSDFNDVFARYVAMQPGAVAETKAHAEALKEQSKWLSDWAASREKEAAGIADQVTKAQEYLYNLGLTKEAQERLAAGKYELAAAAKEEYAANLENAAAYAGEFKDAYLEAAEAVREQAAALNELAAIKRETSVKEIAVSQAKESARAWDKFADDIERSLTDSLYRSFESGKSFGQSFVDALKNTFKTTLLRMAVQYTINAGGQIAGAAGNSLINSVLGTGSANGGGGVNYFNVASNASSLYGLATGTYLGYAQAAGAGYAMTSSEAAAAAQAYYSAGYYGTGASIQAGNLVGGGTAAAGAEAGGAAAGGSASSAAGVSSVAWVAAIIAGMWMSSEAWKAGIRWENYAKQKDVELWDAEVAIRKTKDEPMKAIFGDGFVNSQFYAIAGGGSLSAQIHYAIQKALFGAKYSTGSQTVGTFSEAEQGFTGQYGINMKKTGGLFKRGREWTDWYGLPSEVDAVMDAMYKAVRNGFVMLGETFDDTTIAQKMQGFAYSIYVGSTDMEAVVSAATQNLTKAMADRIIPSISTLQKSGELWTATFERVLSEAQAVNRIVGLMGDTMSSVFGRNNLDNVLKASDAFVQLFGSIDALNSSFSAYYANFYTGLDQVNQAWKEMAAAFTDIGITNMPTTRAQFRALVDSLDLNTEGGRSTFKSLMSLQGAFASLTPTIDEAAAAAKALANVGLEDQAKQIGAYYTAQRQALANTLRNDISARQDAISTAQSMIEALGSVITSLGGYRDTLVAGAASVSPAAQYAQSRQMFDQTAARARLGDIVAANSLQSVSESFLRASLAIGTASSYAGDVGMVAGTLDTVIGVAERQVPIAQSQLQVAQDQLATLEQMLERMTGGTPTVVANYGAALTDWQSFFTSTTIGQAVQTSAGTMQRIADTIGLFVDQSGRGYTFNSSDSPYALAGMSQDFADYMKQKYGTWQPPAFAGGGLHGGGLRLVGERGPELEITGPSRILNAADSMSIVSNWSAMLVELQALRAEVASLRQEEMAVGAAVSGNTGKVARILDKFDTDGMPEQRVA